jgi:hypothetical protein
MTELHVWQKTCLKQKYPLLYLWYSLLWSQILSKAAGSMQEHKMLSCSIIVLTYYGLKKN